ncbi:MAG TPA: sigma-70 family RNA polymerase sigma factor [Gemmatimonadales bacterium]|nr:sigma-70 family RNA polymerase sigma factor [Gemmatimonadales bacterium]
MTGIRMAGVAELVRRARDEQATVHQQQAAFTVLVERFEHMAFATAYRLSPDADQARDACQEAFLLAWRSLRDLREPAAFGAWLGRLVRTQCARARRRRGASPPAGAGPAPRSEGAPGALDLLSRSEMETEVRRAVAELPDGEREAVTLFYFLGEPLRIVARALGVSLGTAGKRVYTARLRLRRTLRKSVTEEFLAGAPTPSFGRRVQAGIFDEFVGEYRFVARPDHRVVVRREGGVLAGYAGGQRNLLWSPEADALAPMEYDGEARFRRNRCGRVTEFVYYEFGRRIGVARKIPASP